MRRAVEAAWPSAAAKSARVPRAEEVFRRSVNPCGQSDFGVVGKGGDSGGQVDRFLRKRERADLLAVDENRRDGAVPSATQTRERKEDRTVGREFRLLDAERVIDRAGVERTALRRPAAIDVAEAASVDGVLRFAVVRAENEFARRGRNRFCVNGLERSVGDAG